MNPANETTRAIDVGGRRLVLTTSGDGAPTVVLETGLGAESDEWAAVQRAIAPVARVCRYDRAGRGASDPAARPRSAADLVADLHTLLQGADLPPPYLLVGHSFGGLLMRLFADRHRSLVAGLMLVDAMHEDQFGVFGPAFPPPQPGEPAALAEVREFWTRGWRDSRSTPEGLDLVASCAQARAIGSLGDLPLHVLSAGTFVNQPLVPDGLRPRLQSMWDGLQQRLAGLSARSMRSAITGCGHFLQREAPQQVAAAIAAMVQRVRVAA
ncbi:MAG TPA: alpha/beta hydrolase [Burkholderiaceae bacterium]|nr:alpha/beta hydrolase [Burkholderiaceae bacterium]